ncbi:MAG: RnfABCDGE type electron transport complex subunit G [Anaerovoracaceae bacterium]
MKNNFKEYIKPTLVLVVIALTVSLVLALTYKVTDPQIKALNIKMANEARQEVLPKAEGYQELKVDNKMYPDIVDCYQSTNKVGDVITSLDSGFGGKIKVMTGFDENGQITGVKVLEHAETPGLGTQAMTVEYLKQYTKANVTQKIKTKKINSEDGEATEIDTITGATITSNAVFRAVDKAREYFALNFVMYGKGE